MPIREGSCEHNEPLLHHIHSWRKTGAVQLDVFGQEFLDEIVTMLIQNLFEVTTDNGFVGCG
jgi:hypothetical protein